MSDHAHEWRDGPTTERERVDSSPYSRNDDHLRVDILLTQTCACGATRRLWLGYKNQRRRGDDERRARGLQPLGRPLQSSFTFSRPKVLR